MEAGDRILPEVSGGPGRWVVRSLENRGAHVHLNAHVVSARDGHVVLSTGEEFDSNLIVWTVGNGANPMVRSHTDLPIDERGMLIVRADLRVGAENEPVPDAWGAGDDAAVPDLAAGRPGVSTVPNAQHAVRQGKLLARNIVATLRGRMTKPYVHHSLGTVATLGLGRGIFQYRGIVIKGLPAWLMHRGYHVLAVPSWERKIRVLAVWLTAAVFGRDIVRSPRCRTPAVCSSPAANRWNHPRSRWSDLSMTDQHDDVVRRFVRAGLGWLMTSLEALPSPLDAMSPGAYRCDGQVTGSPGTLSACLSCRPRGEATASRASRSDEAPGARPGVASRWASGYRQPCEHARRRNRRGPHRRREAGP